MNVHICRFPALPWLLVLAMTGFRSCPLAKLKWARKHNSVKLVKIDQGSSLLYCLICFSKKSGEDNGVHHSECFHDTSFQRLHL